MVFPFGSYRNSKLIHLLQDSLGTSNNFLEGALPSDIGRMNGFKRLNLPGMTFLDSCLCT